MSEVILETKNLHFQYPDGTTALRDVSITFERGKKYVLLGPNGAGKSTFLLHLIGILKPTDGKIFFKQKELKYNRTSLTALRSKVGLVFQDPDSQLFSTSVWQEVSFGPLNLSLPKEQVKARVQKALEETGICHLKQKPPHMLSYGQKKLVSVAGILAMEPEFLILDEPTSSLDPESTGVVWALFNKIHERGITLLVVTHDLETAYEWADTVIIMKNGQIAGQGKPQVIFSDDGLLAENYLTKPWLPDIFSELQRAGYLPENSPVPNSKRELIQLIRQNAHHKC